MAVFPSDFAAERELQLSTERRELHTRIDALRAELGHYAPPPRGGVSHLPARVLGLGEPPAA